MLVELTAEDIQREHPPSVQMVCGKCRDWYRSAARLVVNYSTGTAIRDFGLFLLAGVSLLLLFLVVASSSSLVSTIRLSQIVFFATSLTFLSGLRMLWGELRGRYGFTHNLQWSLQSRYAMLSLAIISSGVVVSSLYYIYL